MKNDENKIPSVVNDASELPDDFANADFEFVHRNAGEKIHDKKFEGKPTTFAKDAFRRFCKNKSSVVAAVIIGVLMVGSVFAEVVSPYDIHTPQGTIAKLVPKIRNGGDGFWDGTQFFSGQNYDEEKHLPVGFEERAVVPGSVSFDGIEYQTGDAKSGFAYGSLFWVADSTSATHPAPYFFETYRTLANAKVSDELKITVSWNNVEDINNYLLAPVSIYLTGKDYVTYADCKIPVAADQKMKGEATYDIAAAMTAAGITNVEQARIRFEMAPDANKRVYSLIDAIKVSTGVDASEKAKLYASNSTFGNANHQALTGPNKEPDHYWRATGTRQVYNAYRHTCSFRYDQYEAVLGKRTDITVGGSQIRQYIKNGWCEMSDLGDISTFKLKYPGTDICPIIELYSVTESTIGGKTTYEYSAKIYYYRYLGFSSMPMFVFGTDSDGIDMLTKSLSCLKNSLLLAVITSGVCLIIGLIWGSISGYFGGSVDLIMERITDILSGVPWIVVMTLVMLLLNRTIVTFGIAICLTGWIGTSSRTRTQFYRFKGREYVLASRTLGASDARLIFRHILPNGLGTIVTGSVLMIPSTIFSEATLSYLGLGINSGDSFGVLLANNQVNLNSRPMLIIWPSIIIALLMISFNLFGNGLRDALNPTLKGGEQ